MFFSATARTEEAMLKAIAKYEKATRFMKGDMNSQKLDMANMVIKYVVQTLSEYTLYIPLSNSVIHLHRLFSDSHTFCMTKRMNENYNKIINICLSSLLGCEYKFGHHSLEYVAALAGLMDVNAIFGRSSGDKIELNDFDCLSNRTKAIFVNYFETFC